MKVLRADQYATVPWRNGGGTTREIAAYHDPNRHHDFLWRLSIATVAKPGPFSRFDGVERTIAVLDGEGMALHAASRSKVVTPRCPPFSFEGETEIFCELVAGPTNDLNVMTRCGFYKHKMRREQLLGWMTIEGINDETIVVSSGALEVSSHGRTSLRALDTVTGIARGSACDLFSDRATEIFIVELTAL